MSKNVGFDKKKEGKEIKHKAFYQLISMSAPKKVINALIWIIDKPYKKN